MTKLLNLGVRVSRIFFLGASAAASGSLTNAELSPLVAPRASTKPLGAGLLSGYARAPPPAVGPLPLPFDVLEAGGVGPSGAAGSAAMGGLYVSASSYPANAPVEDRFDTQVARVAASSTSSSSASTTSSTSTSTLTSSQYGVLLLAVFDGHGGWQAAEHARNTLLTKVAAELEAADNTNDPTALGAVLARSFVSVDTTFLKAIQPSFALGFGGVAHVGACALAAIITPRFIVVANAGDCRAVLGRLATVSVLGRGGGWGVLPGAGLGVASDEDLTDGHATAAAALVYGSGRAVRLVPVGMDGGDFTILPEPAW